MLKKRDKTPEMDGESFKKEAERCEIEYELETDAHEKCKNFDVVEAIEENYQGTLNDLKVAENHPSRFILVQKVKEEPFEKDDEKRINFVYRVIVKNDDVAKNLIESWKDQYKFDDLAFRHAVYDKIQVRIQKVKKI